MNTNATTKIGDLGDVGQSGVNVFQRIINGKKIALRQSMVDGAGVEKSRSCMRVVSVREKLVGFHDTLESVGFVVFLIGTEQDVNANSNTKKHLLRTLLENLLCIIILVRKQVRLDQSSCTKEVVRVVLGVIDVARQFVGILLDKGNHLGVKNVDLCAAVVIRDQVIRLDN